MRPYLVTGAAGFIGFHVARRLLDDGHEVVGIDNLNDYYDPALKHRRLTILEERPAFTFVRGDVGDRHAIQSLFDRHRPARVVHLAAQAGVRYSLTHPEAYIQSNIVGFFNILEACRHAGVEHLVYASSSSVYGVSTATPFSEHEDADHPVSLYAATKRSNELMAHTYSHLYRLPTTGLRFFTVYGPWGRPDMALFLFTDAILHGKPIQVFNNGDMRRDFTFIDDIVEGVVRALRHAPRPDPSWDSRAGDRATSSAPFRVYNIGNNQPVDLLRFIAVIEECLGKQARKVLLPLQPGDVPETAANVDDLMSAVGFTPSTPIETGIPRFIDWYKQYYGLR
ncbi:MAG: NAD-dependent epimerase [SAR202 cluster bacterium]|nr:NAD-dependent epimerase [SAR202 cluster bacterium]